MEYAPPAIPNPYSLLSQLPPEAGWSTCLDLRDTFFCIRLATQSQSLFAFEWTDPDTGQQLQLTWTRLPQGFKNSPTLFGEAPASDLATFPREEYRCTLLQYMDDLLLACATETKCQTATQALLSYLAETGYRVSWKKAQLYRKQVQYLGFVISKGQRALSTERKKVITSLPRPTNRRALREFLGAAGFCRIRIPGFSAIAWPLYEALTGQEKSPMLWTEDKEHAFQQLKSSFGQDPALGLPDAERPFHLFVHERDKIALGLLAQTVGPWLCPITYFSKKLDPVATGLLAKNFYISRLSALCKPIRERCLACAKNNPKSGPSPIPGIQRSGTTRFVDLEVDFTDMTNCRGTKYLLILVCTYSGWVEAFHNRTEKSCEVAKVPLREIIPCYGIPLSLHSDNGPAFIAELLQTVTRAMGINWRLHTAYRPQSSGKLNA
ncbi:hypothetical protein mRhiFer1_008247 [Rhinolophus ferrumequinum]|uniref:Integrase catalytic domain-containing protein n=1 Tax=Rhinolophus ferrumequinum TaxID=59479 RepID=A0A7J7VR85_RHIFE|nr:hypothetical protein mRhiFer1_008247 [Rhinolophus ferrumequinum]